MYTIISATNRANSNTLKIANIYQQVLQQKGVEAAIFSLEDTGILQKGAAFDAIATEILQPTNYFIFICPEYNGSFPGVLKLLIDNSQPSRDWWHKKALVTGVATGRAGNLRGIDHLISILHHLKMSVLPHYLPISQVDKLLDEQGQLHDTTTQQLIDQQITAFLNFTK